MFLSPRVLAFRGAVGREVTVHLVFFHLALAGTLRAGRRPVWPNPTPHRGHLSWAEKDPNCLSGSPQGAGSQGSQPRGCPELDISRPSLQVPGLDLSPLSHRVPSGPQRSEEEEMHVLLLQTETQLPHPPGKKKKKKTSKKPKKPNPPPRGHRLANLTA